MNYTTADSLVDCLQSNPEEFKCKISDYLEHNDVMDFIHKCNDEQIESAVDMCAHQKIFLVHKIFEKVKTVESIEFLNRNPSHYKHEKIFFDLENRTWLHIAVIFNRGIEILDFLTNIIKIKVDAKDVFRLTPLHFACQKDICVQEELRILIKEADQLIKPSISGLTPLEFLCKSEKNLACLQDLEIINIKKLLREIDKVTHGVVEVEPIYCNTNLPNEKLWLNILQANGKYLLIRHIQKDSEFYEKYYLSEKEFMYVIRNCPDNGEGIFTYIKKLYLQEPQDRSGTLKQIFQHLAGMEIKERREKHVFYKSCLFLSLITGRFELINFLVEYTQFEIVPYALLMALICKNLAVNSTFSDTTIDEIVKLKTFCELYAIEVMNRTSNKDLSPNKTVIIRYIANKSPQCHNKSLLDIAYQAKCKRFLSLPACQKTLDYIWRRGKLNSPIFKFFFHSAVHILFLALFSYVLVERLYAKITLIEIPCYVYGLGYLCEESRQMYFCWIDDTMSSYYKDPTNVVDLFALLFMLLGFLIRVFVPIPTYAMGTNITLTEVFKESKEFNLFIIRLFLCVSLILFYTRMLYFLSIFEVFGPKLKMIGKMIVKDLLPLLVIFSVFIIAFGVTFQALLFPNSFYAKQALPQSHNYEKKQLLAIIGDIFRRATFSIFDAHYTLDEIENNQNEYITDGTGKYAVYFLLIAFIFVVNVLLMNLLIALFSYTVTVIVSESKKSWKSSRYKIIKDYRERSLLPPPINIAEIIVEISKYICKTRGRRNRKRENSCALIQSTIESEDELITHYTMSYYIFQALAVRNNRYQITGNKKDKKYEKDKRMKEIERTLKDISSKVSKIIEDSGKPWLK